MYIHSMPIMATVRKWRGKICLAFLFRVSLYEKSGCYGRVKLPVTFNEKSEFAIFCFVIVDFSTVFLQKCFLSSPFSIMQILSK